MCGKNDKLSGVNRMSKKVDGKVCPICHKTVLKEASEAAMSLHLSAHKLGWIDDDGEWTRAGLGLCPECGGNLNSHGGHYISPRCDDCGFQY